MTKKTVGEEATERLADPDTKQGVVDTEREMNKEYISEIMKCIDDYDHRGEPFYIVVMLKKERLLENVMRRYFIPRKSLPTPQWDQDVWRYEPVNGDLHYLWTLPDENTAKWLAASPREAAINHGELVSFVLNFLDKKLYQHFYDKYHKNELDNVDLKDTQYSKITPLIQEPDVYS